MQRHCGSGNICAYFTEDSLSCHRTDAGYVSQIDAKDPIQFSAQVKDAWFVSLPLIRQSLGAFRQLRAFIYQVYTIVALTDRDIDWDGEGIFG